MLKNKILNRESGYLFYGLTPPKKITDKDKLKEIAEKQIKRIKELPINGLVLYDIQDESSRNNTPRPFPFMPTLAPEYYSNKYLNELNIPKIIYKSVGKYTHDELNSWIKQNNDKVDGSVFVGTPSRNQKSKLTLNEAYKINQDSNSNILLGGVTIPERHFRNNDEHLRIFNKMDKGCNFFISQCVYSVNNTKDFLSDYYYSTIETGRDLAPIIFTLTPCGSLKTLQFMEWLGIDIPKWLNNDLKHSSNILSQSISFCKTIANELLDYCKQKQIPIGFNIESVSIRKEEIEASVELLHDIKLLLEK